MFIEDLQTICRQLPGVKEDIKWDNHLCFSVYDKMFLIVGLDQIPTTASFKVPEEEFEFISTQEYFKPAQYLARHNWVWIENIVILNHFEWETYIRQSYDLVKGKLPKKIQKELTRLQKL